MHTKIVIDEKKLPEVLAPAAKYIGEGRYTVPLDTVERLAPELLLGFVFLTRAEAKDVNIYRAAAAKVGGADHIIVRD
jgi:hypothetical protein